MSVLVIGEVLVDLIWRTGAEEIKPYPGGSPANVALGLRRLGQPATLATCWGDDPAGRLIEAHLERTGLDVRRVRSASNRTTLALAYVDPASGAASYEFLPAWDPDPIGIAPDVALLHTGSLAGVIGPGAERVQEACRHVRVRSGAAVAVDLNVRPAALPQRDAYRAAAEQLVRYAHVVKASDEDLEWLYPGCDPEEAARALLTLGPRLAVVTHGARGATAITATRRVDAPAPVVEVVDTIGAGDAFQAALLDALLGYDAADPEAEVHIPETTRELSELLIHCTVAGALACVRHGAEPPTREEIGKLRALSAL
jgi:fructokinase